MIKNLTSFFAYVGLVAASLAVVCVLYTPVHAQSFNQQINYQGKLTDASGVAVADGDYNMRFWLLSSPSIATTSAVWTESLTGADRVTVTDGLFSVMLGSTTALTGVDFDQVLYLGVEIGGTGAPAWDGEMSPRKILGTVPSAFEAKNSQTVGGIATSSLLRSDQADTADSLITFAGGLTSSASSTISVLNTATTSADAFILGVDTFTSFTGGGLTLTDGVLSANISEDNLNILGAPTDEYVLQASSTAAGGFVWAATSTLGFNDHESVTLAGAYDYITLSGQELTLGQINLTDDVTGTLADGSLSGNVSLLGQSISLANEVIGSLDIASTSLTVSATGLELSGSALALTAGYSIPLTASTTNWNTAFNWGDHALAGYITGISGENFTSLADTQSSLTANRVLFTNGAGSALIDSGDLTFDGSVLAITGSSTISDRLNVEGRTRLNNGLGINIDATVDGGIYFNRDGGDPFINFYESGSQIGQIRADFGTDQIYVANPAGSTKYLVVNTKGSSAGNVGIGTSTPNQKLTVAGNINIDDPFSGLSFLGQGVLYASTTNNNIMLGIGINQLPQTDAVFNTSLGYQAGLEISSGDFNTFAGANSGLFNSTGDLNSYFGSSAGQRIQSGLQNSILGASAGNSLSTSSRSVIVGSDAVASTTGGVEVDNLTVVGYGAGLGLLTGADNNILIGTYAADSLTTGAKNIVLGYDIEAPSNTADNQLNIGNIIFGTDVDGSGTTTSTGNIGIGTSSPSQKLTVAGNIRVTGALFDSTNASGTSGMVLQSTSDGMRWVATSTLGFSSGGASNFVDLTDVTPSSLTANRIFYTNGAGTALVDSADFVFDGSNMGLGTSTTDALFTMDNRSLSGNVTAGISQYIELDNSTLSAVQYGNRTYIKATSTATSTIVGGIIRLEDSTTLGNTVRGFEVQANKGANTQGENTALSGFARTFGVRGYSSGDAGSVFEPAGGFFETGGSTQGNAIRGYSSSITTAELLSLFQETSDFDGTGLLMNFGNGAGSFASTTSKFVDFQNSGTSKFTVTAHGTTTIGDGTTNNQAGLQIGYGGLCVDNDGSCTAATPGTINYVVATAGNSDLAEMYFSSQDLLPGEVVVADGFISVKRATGAPGEQVLGVISTKPGVVMGSDDTSLVAGQEAYPLALKGRVPVRLSDENGDVLVGDPLTLSSLPGVVKKATGADLVVGYALESYNGSKAYTEGYINQFGDDIAAPDTEATNINVDTFEKTPCYFGGGGATGEVNEDDCDVSSPFDESAAAAEAAAQAQYEATQAALAALRNEPAEAFVANGQTVYVGNITMFVDRGYSFAPEQLSLLNELMSTSSLLAAAEPEEEETLWQRIKVLALSFVDGILTISGLQAESVETDSIETKQLCVDGVCITGSELRALLETKTQAAEDPIIEPEPEPEPEENENDDTEEVEENEQEEEPEENGSSATSTPPMNEEEETATSSEDGTDVQNEDGVADETASSTENVSEKSETTPTQEESNQNEDSTTSEDEVVAEPEPEPEQSSEETDPSGEDTESEEGENEPQSEPEEQPETSEETTI